jgi:hypothetical protein
MLERKRKEEGDRGHGVWVKGCTLAVVINNNLPACCILVKESKNPVVHRVLLALAGLPGPDVLMKVT